VVGLKPGPHHGAPFVDDRRNLGVERLGDTVDGGASRGSNVAGARHRLQKLGELLR
jgi:hypothetical protein